MHVRRPRLLISRTSTFPFIQTHPSAACGNRIAVDSTQGVRPRSRTSRAGALAVASVVCIMIVAACTPSAAAPKSTPVAGGKPTATPIPPVLSAYAHAVQPLMRGSASEAAALESRMKHDSLSVIGDECSTFGGDFESAQVTIRGTYTPPAAQVVYHHANGGYRLLAVSTDECGMASDISSKSEMRAAIADLRSGMSQLKYAYGLTKKWAPGS